MALLFRHRARWNSATEVLIYLVVVCLVGVLDVAMTRGFLFLGLAPLAGQIHRLRRRSYLQFPGPALLRLSRKAGGTVEAAGKR